MQIKNNRVTKRVITPKTETEMKDEKKYRFRDNFSGDSYQFISLTEAKKAAKQLTFGYPIYIFKDRDIVAVVEANDKPLP